MGACGGLNSDEEIAVENVTSVGGLAVRHEAAQEMGEAPRSRLAGGGSKLPQAAPVKCRGGERGGKGAIECVR